MKPLLMLLLALLFTSAAAAQHEAESIHVTGPWSRALPPVSQNGAAYVTLMNGGDRADKLIGASSPVAQRAEFHAHNMEGGVMKMRPVTSVELPPGKKVEFKPGGLHVMLIGLRQPLKQGDRFPLTLRFANTPPITVEVVVQSAGAKGPEGMHHEPGGGRAHERHAMTEARTEHGHGKQMNMPAAQAPTLALMLRDGDAGGFVLMLDTTRFRFAKEHVDGPHVAGEGHAHLYVDGKKIRRIYGPLYELKPLAAGVHEIEVSLYTNNHMAYAVDGNPVSQRFVVLVTKSHRSKDSQLQRVDLGIEHGKVNIKDKTIRVAQNDMVELRWSSDGNQTLHLHGYDIEAEVRPNSPVVMHFDAFATGRFPVEIHGGSQGGGAVLVYLEVHPR